MGLPAAGPGKKKQGGQGTQVTALKLVAAANKAMYAMNPDCAFLHISDAASFLTAWYCPF